MKNQKKKVSIEDVAAQAGVSITTVSRVINHFPTVTEDNRLKVEKVVAELGFRPNVSAQRLARGHNNTMGLVMPGYPGIFYSFYAIELIRGVGHACESLKLDLIFHITDGHNPLNTSNVSGIIFADIINNRNQVESAIKEGIPAFVINHIADDININYIGVDNHAGAKIAAEYLTGLGHKKIAMITGALSTQSGLHRYEGFTEALKKKNIDLPEEYVYKGDYSRRSARIAAEQFLSSKNRPTAIFASSDDMALEVIAVIFEKGLKIPEDISVIGFDDNPAAIYGSVSLTTIRQPLFKMAEDSVRYLNAIVTGKSSSPVKIKLLPELVARESCSPPR